MNTLKIFFALLFLGVIMNFGSDIGEWLSLPGARHLVCRRGAGRDDAVAGAGGTIPTKCSLENTG